VGALHCRPCGRMRENMNPRAWVNAHLPASTSLGCNGLGLLPLSGGAWSESAKGATLGRKVIAGQPMHHQSAAPVALTPHGQRNGPEAPKGTDSPLGTCPALTFFGMSPERRSCGTASNSVMWRDFQPRRIAPATAITQPGPRAPVFS
jgi:hypothetical protein